MAVQIGTAAPREVDTPNGSFAIDRVAARRDERDEPTTITITTPRSGGKIVDGVVIRSGAETDLGVISLAPADLHR